MKKSEIDKIFSVGKKSYGNILKVVYTVGTGQVVISAPIKTFERAVDRNKVKRLVRQSIKNLDFSGVNLFIIYNIKEIKTLDEIKQDLKKIYEENRNNWFNGLW